MKLFRLLMLLPANLLLSGVFTLQGQNDLLKDIFGKEDPAFHTEMISENSGRVKMAVYFTHSKLDQLEVSFWILDNRLNAESDNPKKLIANLRNLPNRQVDTIIIDGLIVGKYYAIGVDYRNPGALSKKFSSLYLNNSFLYESPEQKTGTNKEKLTAKGSNPEKAITCQDPDIKVELAPTGYCNLSDKPAILIQCDNCRGKNWSFKVEVKRENSYWVPLRSDGMAQAALGNNLRIEPLCDLGEGNYYARVSAWGENCPTPVVRELRKMINIGSSSTYSPMTYTDASIKGPRESTPVSYQQIPQECEVRGKAYLYNNKIIGNLNMEPNTPCADFNPYAEVRYIHPGYRDIVLEPLSLSAGRTSPFEINLDERDLSRGIHTLQVIVFGRSSTMSEGVPIAAFWLKAEEFTGEQLPPHSLTDEPVNPGLPLITGIPDDGGLWQNIDTISVKASDPNCNQIQNLQLVYDSNKSRIPLFVSWLSPRCCQEKGCTYTVWAGPDPMQTRLIVKGNKSGAIIRELLPGINPDDTYFEVVVETSNGNRKAAYIAGSGPMYGIEAVLDYQDSFRPQESEPLVMPKAASFTYKIPELPFSNFAPCKYKRQSWVTAERPVRAGDMIRIQYDFKDPGHQYSLYFKPQDSNEWVLAPDTRELQDSPVFEFAASPFHSGQYLVLVYKPTNNWGCLSESPDKAVVILVD